MDGKRRRAGGGERRKGIEGDKRGVTPALDCIEITCVGMGWNGLEWVGMRWNGLGCVGMRWDA